MKKILEIQNLTVHLSDGPRIIEDVSFDINKQQCICLTGPLGSGKSSLLRAVLFGPKLDYKIISGDVTFFIGNKSYKVIVDGKFNKTGSKIFQKHTAYFASPEKIFNPYKSVGSQVANVIKHAQKINYFDAKTAAIVLMKKCQIYEAADLYHCKPGQLKQGVLFKAMLAMALGKGAKLWLFDKKFDSIDLTVQSLIIDLIKDLKKHHDISILASERLATALQMSDSVIFMNSGKVIGTVPASDFQQIYFDQSNLMAFLKQKVDYNV